MTKAIVNSFCKFVGISKSMIKLSWLLRKSIKNVTIALSTLFPGYSDGFKVNAHTTVLDTETTRNFGNLWASLRDFHTLFWNEGNISN